MSDRPASRGPEGAALPPALPPRYARRIRDLREWHIIRAVCVICGHARSIPLARLTANRDPHEFLKHMEPKLRCKSCGAIGDNYLDVAMAPRNG